MSFASSARIVERLLFASRSRTVFLVAIHDIVMVFAAYTLGAVLASEPLRSFEFAMVLGGAVAAALPALYLSGAHRQVWRYVDLRDIAALAAATVAVAVGALLASALAGVLNARSLSTDLVGCLVLLLLWSGPRLAVRGFRDRLVAPELVSGPEPVLLAGAGERARAFLRANAEHRRFSVVGLLSDDPGLHDRRIGGAPVLGSLQQLDRILSHQQLRGTRPVRLIIAADTLSRDALQRNLEAAAAHNLLLSRAPDAAEVKDGEADAVRPVAVDDLLSRPPAELDRAAMGRLIEGKVVLITGAGGSIGSELVRQAAALNPSLLVLVENNEFNLYRIDLECGRDFPNQRRTAALCDVRDKAALGRWFTQARPDLVVHAAALKHVPMLEEHPEEGVLTNVLGTRNVIELAREHRAEAVVLVSTDKAVNPTSVMGATKRCAEVLCQGYDALRRAGDGQTRCLSVRFGNVLGSAGSVLPLFMEQIAHGGPVTVTHQDMTRFFMTIPESAQLILQATATALASTDETSGVYVLDMGEPVRILDLAERVIQLSGRRPHVDVAVKIVGLRPGEKLHEELAHDHEALAPSAHPGVLVASQQTPPLAAALTAVDRMVEAARRGDRAGVLRAILGVAPEFAPANAAIRSAIQPLAPPEPAKPIIRVVR
jgi:O-antigen biosynthesis protein WbqV